VKPYSMTATVNQKRYNTATATVIAHNAYWDGHNWERHGTNCYLYRTVKGGYFAQHLTQWQGGRDRLEPLTLDAALELWESLPERPVEFEAAFPGVAVTEA
jgi:hypothetical protein